MKTRKGILLATVLIIMVGIANAQEIFDAVKADDLAKVKALVGKDLSLVGLKDANGNTPLQIAAEIGSTSSAEYLIAKGSRLDEKNKDGNSPLHVAALSGHVGMVDLFLMHKADLRAVNVQQNTPLHLAIINGKDDAAKRLIDEGSDLGLKNIVGKTPLHLTVRHSRRAVAEILIAKGSEIDSRDDMKRTPLQLAARETGNVEIARLLIQHGADINAQDADGWTSLNLAAWKGFNGIINLLLDRNAEFTTANNQDLQMLRFAADCGSVRLFQKVAENRSQLFEGEARNLNTMRRAIGGGSVEIVKILLAKNIPIPAEADAYGWTPLHVAASKGHAAMVEFVVGKGADLNRRTLSGKSAYNLAEEAGKKELLPIIIKRGGSPDPQKFPSLSGPYLGQAAPEEEPKLFAPDIVSSRRDEANHSSLAISPQGDELYWQERMAEAGPQGGWSGIRTTKLRDGRWTKPQLVPFSGKPQTQDDAPFISPDNKKMFFVSTRPLGTTARNKENIWFAERTQDGWSEPKSVGPEVNGMQLHWQVSVSNAGTLYFSGNRPDGQGGYDVYSSPMVNGEYSTPVNLGPVINGQADEYSPFIAPDESYLIFSRFAGPGESGFFISFKDQNGRWQTPARLDKRLGPVCPIVSPDGKYLFYLGGGGIFWASAKFIEEMRSTDATRGQAIFDAVRANDLGRVKKLIDKAPGLLQAKDANGWTPLHWAVRAGPKEIAELLLEKGADPNARDASGDTPINKAVARGRKETIDVLLDRGSFFDASGEKALNIVQLSAQRGLERLFEAAVKKGGDGLFADPSKNKETMRGAIQGGSVEIIKMLLTRNIPIPKEADIYGWTPVHYAANGYSSMQPYVTFDNKTLYFGWQRPMPESKQNQGWGIWVTKRTKDGWTDPGYAGQGMWVSSSRDGRLYVGVVSSEGNYLAKATVQNGVFAGYERLPIRSSRGEQMHPCLAPDGGYILFDTGGDHLSVSFKKSDGTWGEAIDLWEHGFDPIAGGACISPDGKYLFFKQGYGSNRDIWWVDIKAVERLRPKNLLHP